MSTPEAPIRMSTRWPGERSAYGNAEFITPNNLPGARMRHLNGGGTETARLRDNRHSTTWPQRPAKLLEPRLWVGPHPQVVNNQCLVKRLAEITEIQGGSESQLDSTLLDSSPVADGRLANHDLGVVDSEHEPVGCAARQLADRESRDGLL
jgi:hypothetical protein